MEKALTTIQQGDAYYLPIVIAGENGTPLTDEDVSGVRIGIGEFSATYPGTVEYDNGQWMFPLTQEMTYALTSGMVDFQVQVKMGNDVVYGSRVKKVTVDKSLLIGVW